MKIMLIVSCLEWLTCLQWNPVNTVTNRPKKLAVFTGDSIILRGFFFTRKCTAFLPGGKKQEGVRRGFTVFLSVTVEFKSYYTAPT